MEKDFQQWHKVKAEIHNKKTETPFFHEREIWWCSLGANVGYEQDGKGKQFSRPVVVLKKFNRYVFLSAPLTTKTANKKYYFRLPKRKDSVVLSQIRLLDSRRLLKKIASISQSDFWAMKKAITVFFQ